MEIGKCFVNDRGYAGAGLYIYEAPQIGGRDQPPIGVVGIADDGDTGVWACRIEPNDLRDRTTEVVPSLGMAGVCGAKYRNRPVRDHERKKPDGDLGSGRGGDRKVGWNRPCRSGRIGKRVECRWIRESDQVL